MVNDKFTVQKVIQIFGADISRNGLIKAENSGAIPVASRTGGKSQPRRTWTLAELPQIGERYGFLKKLKAPMAVAFFTTKGGVLKSTMALNLARVAALHNLKVCIVGLDMQCDITNALGYQVDLDDAENLDAALAKLGAVYGLADFADGKVPLESIIMETNLPTLSFIPETPDLVALERQISGRNMRDLWLKERVVEPLKKRFDLVILDCSPNWNLLISNALMASDVLISPLECKINNYRNYQAFKAYLDNFKRETRRDFAHVFVPTKFAASRKLSSDIRAWYRSNVPGCINGAIRESVHSEEAIASHISLIEHSPNSIVGDEMRETLSEIWDRIMDASKKIDDSNVLTDKRKTKTRRDSERNIEG